MKSYTDLEQSKKLAEILPLESADMYYYLDPTPAGNIYHLVVQRVDFGIKSLPQYNEGDIPCWSLVALLNILPNYQLQTQDDGIGILCSYNGKFNIVTADNPVDACVELIIKLKEQNLI